MIDIIKEALAAEGIALWRINVSLKEGAELYFVKNKLDLSRQTSLRTYSVTVFRAFEKNGKEMLGMSTATISPSASPDSVRASLADAYFGASFVANPTFSMPEAVVAPTVELPASLRALSLSEVATQMAAALYRADTDADALINSSELFVSRATERVLSSYGTDVAYETFSVDGEFVVQCKEPQDVEMYHSFRYDKPDGDALCQKAKDALRYVKDRAKAGQRLAGGEYTVLLSHDHVKDLFAYFVDRADASMIYSGYSTYQVGESVQSENRSGEAISVTLRARHPYSDTGVPMIDRPLFRDGKLCCIAGSDRFCSYLGVPMTGYYTSFVAEGGTRSFADLQKEPHLYVVSFSDFQVDELSGHFGGEIRLAYYYDGQTTRIVTGGSINGSIADCKDSLIFSLEQYDSLPYRGPLAVRIPAVKVAGTEEA